MGIFLLLREEGFPFQEASVVAEESLSFDNGRASGGVD